MRNLLGVVGRHEWRTKYDIEGRPFEMCGRPGCYRVRGHSPSGRPYTGTDRGLPRSPFNHRTWGGGMGSGADGGGG
jgi:hypothetical protein